jgi:hypothetical protein
MRLGGQCCECEAAADRFEQEANAANAAAALGVDAFVEHLSGCKKNDELSELYKAAAFLQRKIARLQAKQPCQHQPPLSSGRTKLRDLTGQKFGRLTVLERSHDHGEQPAWRCRCDCGAEHFASGDNLKRGLVRSCGCARVGANRARRRTGAA